MSFCSQESVFATACCSQPNSFLIPFSTYMVGFLYCLKRSYQMTAAKCFISDTSLISTLEILTAIQITRDEMIERKHNHFFTFGSCQQGLPYAFFTSGQHMEQTIPAVSTSRPLQGAFGTIISETRLISDVQTGFLTDMRDAPKGASRMSCLFQITGRCSQRSA